MKKVIVSVTNDLFTDQRVHKMCKLLDEDLGFQVLLIGRKLKGSKPLNRDYKTKRIKLLFNKGPLFYLEYNFRLFWVLLFKKSNLLLSNDLDTLLANFLVARIKRIHIVYDTHEYFTGVPELENNPFAKGVWEKIEQWIFPKLKHIITVNDSIASLYKRQYKKDLTVVRNIPPLRDFTDCEINREKLNLPANKNIIILQGAGINVDRGAEEAVEAMQYVQNSVLYIIGSGDVIGILKQNTSKLGLNDKVKFLPKMPYEQLMMYTINADLGLTLDKNTNINYRYSLPNKLFDYIQAGIPVLSSNLVEIEKIINQYKIGTIVHSHNPKQIAKTMNEIFNDKKRLNNWKENAKKAANKLCWENEKTKVIDVYKKFT